MTSILGGQRTLQYGTTMLEYELLYSERRTLAIHVYPDGSVVVDAPLGSSLPDIELKLLRRATWVLRQQRQFQEYAPPQTLPHRYVSGETFAYLGRQYRLKIVEAQVERVVLSRGYLTVTVHEASNKPHIANAIERWYRGHAQRVFSERLIACYPRVEPLGILYPKMSVRRMKSRWGSCTSGGNITLNPLLIQVAKPLIDYVLIHELCHLKEHSHGSAFYALLDRILPDWQERRKRLNQFEVS